MLLLGYDAALSKSLHFSSAKLREEGATELPPAETFATPLFPFAAAPTLPRSSGSSWSLKKEAGEVGWVPHRGAAGPPRGREQGLHVCPPAELLTLNLGCDCITVFLGFLGTQRPDVTHHSECCPLS